MSWYRWVSTASAIVIRSAGFHVVFGYRLMHTWRQRFGPVGRVAAALCGWFIRHWYCVTISPDARLCGGLILPHPHGITIGPGVLLGPRAWVFQNVTIGGAPGKEGAPRIGANARIYAGAVISGPVTIGQNVAVGANTVVSRDIPDRVMVRSPELRLGLLPEAFLARIE